MQLTASSLLALAALAGASSAAAAGHEDAPRMLHKRQAASSGMTLTGPGPGEVFKTGGTCTVTWSPDTSGSSAWKSWTLDFMTGANQNMVKLGTIATGLDGTSSSVTSYSWSCPQVSPYSAIYFYQATSDATGQTVANSPQWTTRWAISDAEGKTTAPPHANQPQPANPAIPWGAGKLISTITTAQGGSSSGSSGSGSSSSGSTGSGASGSAGASSGGSVSAPAADSVATSSPSSSANASVNLPQSVSTNSPATTTNMTTSSSNSKSGASALNAVPALSAGLAVLAAVALVL